MQVRQEDSEGLSVKLDDRELKRAQSQTVMQDQFSHTYLSLGKLGPVHFLCVCADTQPRNGQLWDPIPAVSSVSAVTVALGALVPAVLGAGPLLLVLRAQELVLLLLGRVRGPGCGQLVSQVGEGSGNAG